MPFTRQSSYLLTVAVAAAMSPTIHAAPADFWQCHTLANGDFQCTEALNPPKESLVAPVDAAPLPEVPSLPQPVAEPLPETAPGAESQPAAKPAEVKSVSEESVSVTPASAAEAVTATPVVAPVPQTTAASEATATQQALPATTEQEEQPEPPPANTAPVAIPARTPSQLDWYTDAGGQCSGRYIEPEYREVIPGSEEEVIINADQSMTQIGSVSEMQGDIQLQQGNRTLSGQLATLDQTTNIATLEGEVTYREPGLLIIGSDAQSNLTTKETRFQTADYVLHQQEIRGAADTITRQEDGRINLQEGFYTACPPGDESWKIKADEVVLNPEEGFGEATHATLRIGDVPVFYAPYFTFPIDDQRRSGFLYPTIGYSESEGLELATPYYINIAPNIDDTITPHLYSNRGLSLENEFRYKNSYSENVLSTAFLPDDDIADRDRWLFDLQHDGVAGNFRTNVDITRVSDDDYFNDLNTGLDVNRQAHLDQLAEASYAFNYGTLTTRVQSYQTITTATQPYRKLPQIAFSGSQDNLFADNLDVGYLADFTAFDRDNDNLTGTDRVTGQRSHLQPSVSYPMRWPWAHVTPKATLWHTQYNLDDQVSGQSSNITRSVGIFSVDSGVSFERTFDSGTIQTLEPRLFGLYVPEEDQTAIPNFDTAEYDFTYSSLFRENRFSGYDKIGDTEQVSLGLSSGFYGSRGNEIARVSLGQAFYFADRTVQLESTTAPDTTDYSNYALEAIWNITDSLRVSNDSELEASDYRLIENNLKLSYSPDVDRVVSVSYRDRDDTREQVDLSFLWPVSNSWSVLGRWQEDLRNNTTPETLLGVEYADCCWTVRLAAREWLPSGSTTRDSGIYLQFVLKGLGAFGQGGSGLFNNITGFEEREAQNEY